MYVVNKKMQQTDDERLITEGSSGSSLCGVSLGTLCANVYSCAAHAINYRYFPGKNQFYDFSFFQSHISEDVC